MELEDFKSEFRDIVYDALQRHAEVLKRSYGWGVFASIMSSIAKDVEHSLRFMGREASCNAGLVISSPRLVRGTESYGKAFISCTIKRPGEKEKKVTAYIPMSAVVTLKDERATVIVFGIGEKEDIEVE